MNEVNKLLNLLNFNLDIEAGAINLSCGKHLSIPETLKGVDLTSLGAYLFANKKFTSLDMADKIVSIGTSCFSDNRLQTLKLSNELVKIGPTAFNGNRLKLVILPPKIKELGELSFATNPLQVVVAPPSLINIHHKSFRDTHPKLLFVCVKDSYAHRFAVRSGNRILLVSEKELNSYYEMDNLTSTYFITKYKEVEGTEDSECKSDFLTLFNISMDTSNGKLSKTSESQSVLVMPQTIEGFTVEIVGAGLFSNRGLTNVIMSPGLRTIEEFGFSHNNLTKVVLPNQTLKLGARAFYSNPRLNSIVIPPSTVDIHSECFLEVDPEFIITCVEDSYAHSFATKHGYYFNLISNQEMDSLYESYYRNM